MSNGLRPETTLKVDPRARATKDDVLTALEAAHVAMVGAAAVMFRRYGASEQVTQITGAAVLVSEDWIPAVQAEAGP